MTHAGRSLTPTSDASVADSALEAMNAAELRTLLRDIIPMLDASARARLVNMAVERAARNGSGWLPEAPGDEAISEIVAFAKAATLSGGADAPAVDGCLRQGTLAFLGKRYRAASEIFHAFLMPIARGDVYLGEEELVDEVLGVDLAACAAQYIMSVYMTAATDSRAARVLDALDQVNEVGGFWQPLKAMERVAMEPLPEFDAFLVQWRALIERRATQGRRDVWDHWLREVVQRTEGADGLARVARASRRSEDLRAWCAALLESKDWKAALAACVEAAELVDRGAWVRGELLDSAALAAQRLDDPGFHGRLETAWREAPTMLRLRRWLGSAQSREQLQVRVSQALRLCPAEAQRQRGLLCVLAGELASAAEVLAEAPGLGWSNDEHPGHLLFSVFSSLLGGARLQAVDCDALTLLSSGGQPQLPTPSFESILELAGVSAPSDPAARDALIGAMRRAAEKRIAGVTEHKRRHHYDHAAQLVAACAALQPTGAGSAWVDGIRAEYRRYPALQRELSALGV